MAVKKKAKKKTAKKSVKTKAVKAESCPACCSGMGNLNSCDYAMMKLSIAAFMIFLVTVSMSVMNFVQNIHWGWWLALTIILGFRPFIKYWS